MDTTFRPEDIRERMKIILPYRLHHHQHDPLNNTFPKRPLVHPLYAQHSNKECHGQQRSSDRSQFYACLKESHNPRFHQNDEPICSTDLDKTIGVFSYVESGIKILVECWLTGLLR